MAQNTTTSPVADDVMSAALSQLQTQNATRAEAAHEKAVEAAEAAQEQRKEQAKARAELQAEAAEEAREAQARRAAEQRAAAERAHKAEETKVQAQRHAAQAAVNQTKDGLLRDVLVDPKDGSIPHVGKGVDRRQMIGLAYSTWKSAGAHQSFAPEQAYYNGLNPQEKAEFHRIQNVFSQFQKAHPGQAGLITDVVRDISKASAYDIDAASMNAHDSITQRDPFVNYHRQDMGLWGHIANREYIKPVDAPPHTAPQQHVAAAPAAAAPAKPAAPTAHPPAPPKAPATHGGTAQGNHGGHERHTQTHHQRHIEHRHGGGEAHLAHAGVAGHRRPHGLLKVSTAAVVAGGAASAALPGDAEFMRRTHGPHAEDPNAVEMDFEKRGVASHFGVHALRVEKAAGAAAAPPAVTVTAEATQTPAPVQAQIVKAQPPASKINYFSPGRMV